MYPEHETVIMIAYVRMVSPVKTATNDWNMLYLRYLLNSYIHPYFIDFKLGHLLYANGKVSYPYRMGYTDHPTMGHVM